MLKSHKIWLDRITPDKPLLVPLPSQIVNLLPHKSVTERFLILTTVEPEPTVANAFIAAEAVIEMAAKQGLTLLVIPLIGAGVNGLDPPEVAVALLQAIQKALVAKQPESQKIQEITIVAQQQAPIEAARRLFPENYNYLAQRPYNDLAQGQDLLNIQTEVHALAEVLLMRDVEPPLAVGILGGWGSGKSFVMHLMQQKMNEIRSLRVNADKAWDKQTDSNSSELFPYVGHIYQIKFDAWTYAKSNLWASLMETIFFELNRQLTLEKQLEDVGINPLNGGQIWEVLNDMSDEERQSLITKEVGSSNWDKILSNTELEDQLFQTLDNVKEKEQKDLTTKEKVLSNEQLELEKTKKQIKKEVAEQVYKDDALKPVAEEIKKILGAKFDDLQEQLQKSDGNQIEIDYDNIDWLKSKIDKIKLTQLINIKTLIKWARTNWKLIFACFLFIMLSILAPVALSKITITNNLVSKLTATFASLIPAIITAQSLLKTLRNWYELLENSFDRYRKRLEELREEKLKEKLNNPKIKQAEERIRQLKIQVEGQRQRLTAIQDLSFGDFVNAQLEKGLYGKRLGLMQQVKSDLANLSQQLSLPPKTNCERYTKKVEKLKPIFPRGPARVVLYIDDLDRCPPKRVVEVLEAVQLLVKTPLFVAVLAIDVRYITRALEKVYAGILNRNGEPSGMHYIEKIIQIPYQVKPIESSALAGYLREQMQIDFEGEILGNQVETWENESPYYNSWGNENSRVVNVQLPNIVNPFIQEYESEALPPQAIKFSQAEFDIVLKCCKYIDLSPRSLKRLVNVYKLIKIIWFRSNQQIQAEQNQDLITLVISFLAMSGRYPDIMRSVFCELKIHIEELETQKEQKANTTFQDFFTKYLDNYLSSYQNNYLRQEYKRFRDDMNILLIPVNLTLNQSVLETFNIIRSFCFIGDIGYDPRDFISTAASNHE
ncbi:MAG: P-loop NTPase fold protein [Nostoc sp. CmiVER01]|uniref:P-loop NTPase fold protein n=1 Tax=Nostoc sp. CmiVER01 TaxID=3075384 RepID=UPI002AD3967F|nr:P-loop NTPase fold protein [Nostoc sp. CmiVER01]MDZ8127240.1 P-loop NTPase fold protein [Nostoc sp. CmiVER01]